MRSASSPLGPFTRTCSSSIATVTPAGTGMGCLPIRDTAPRSPDLRQELAADTRGASVVAGHHAARGRHDRGTHATQDPRDLLGVDIRPLPRTRDAAQAGDRRAPVLGVLEADLDQFTGAVLARGHDRPGLDVALLGEYPRELALELGRRDLDRLVSGVDRVAHPREEVGDRVGHGHRSGTWLVSA